MANYSFSNLPSVSRRRTRFYDPWNKLMTMSVGKLYPIKLQEVIPGDDFSEDVSFVSRLTSAYVRPVMDDLYMDLYAFYIPGRILYDDFELVFGNPAPSAYTDNELSEIPTFSGLSIVTSKSVADYLGLPPGRIPDGVSVLPFRAFASIYNEWFRNENTNDLVFVQTGERSSSEVLNSNPWSASNYTGMLPNVGKIKDYFTSAIPEPQKGAPVGIPITLLNNVPVITAGNNLPASLLSNVALKVSGITSTSVSPGSVALGITHNSSGAITNDVVGTSSTYESSRTFPSGIQPTNLWAQTSGVQTSGFDVDELRLATQRQLMLIADTMFGSRYREYIFGHYGVNIGDSTVQVPQYLCGKRVPLNVQQVAQTSQSAEDSPLASLGGYSYTVGTRDVKYFKAFPEHGYVLWVGCIRYKHTYQQGIHKLWGRTVRDDFYDPLYAHLGYQPIYRSEIFASGALGLKNEIFGWTEAWSEYKHSLREVSGEARTVASNSLDVYHFADNYGSPPVVGQQFNDETPSFVDRTLALPSTTQDQFIVDFHSDTYKTRIMPLFCEPGFMDHWNK